MGRSNVIIGFWIVLLAAAGLIFITSLSEEQSLTGDKAEATGPSGSLPVEEGVFRLSGNAMEFMRLYNSGIQGHMDINGYYSRRAFPGAPPVIPHPVEEFPENMGKYCLQCHGKGGYVAQLSAFAPLTPHADLINCLQCHVPVKTSGTFAASTWIRPAAPETGRQALPGSPPVIPHDLQMRSNCLSCHGGPSAPVEIRVSHPERVNCLQCHVPNEGTSNKNTIWTR